MMRVKLFQHEMQNFKFSNSPIMIFMEQRMNFTTISDIFLSFFKFKIYPVTDTYTHCEILFKIHLTTMHKIETTILNHFHPITRAREAQNPRLSSSLLIKFMEHGKSVE